MANNKQENYIINYFEDKLEFQKNVVAFILADCLNATMFIGRPEEIEFHINRCLYRQWGTDFVNELKQFDGWVIVYKPTARSKKNLKKCLQQ